MKLGHDRKRRPECGRNRIEDLHMNTTLTSDDFGMLVVQALENLRTRPKNLWKAIEFVAQTNDLVCPNPAELLLVHLKTCGPNDTVRHVILRKLQQWDHEDGPDWSINTAAHSTERRADVLRQLGFDGLQASAVNSAIPLFTDSEVPTVIAQQHQRWYEDRKRSIPSFYWKHYEQQLLKPTGSWDSDAVGILDLSTDDVIARLSDPTRPDIYQVKGLVMGYVQSGKTSHFSGLIAKAADAGYRLIVVLAGTLDILRQQTQRRVDKEIVGKELLGSEDYGADVDWSAFCEHGGIPRDLGHSDFERLTTKTDDYSSLKQHLSALQFTRTDPARRFNDPINLRLAPTRIAVIKKTPNRIEKLCDDLKRLKGLRAALEHVPTLIIDDESDQASVNTIDRKKPGNEKARTSTNGAIAKLLTLLPRAQYVGYTATPFANVFIDAEDAEDLFPKDFIVSLPKPDGYMGVADFYDFDGEPQGFQSNRRAFVRAVEGPDHATDNLPKAIDSFVLAGALKLFREHKEPAKYKFRHHTMLVHHSAAKVVHDAEATELRAIFKGGARYQTNQGIQRLAALMKDDFAPVTRSRERHHPMPRQFDDLIPFISDCVSRICHEKAVLIVNGDNKDDTPDFDQRAVWAILVGGAKLSRGYTVEGLTTSYYRRPAGAGDTLMQMGRWFGFRAGYRDLVRLYIGSKERKGRETINLYEAFGAVCRDEEALRTDLRKYAPGGLTPYQVAPLVLQHLPSMPPTSRNKMFNAEIKAMDFAGSWTEKTAAPALSGARRSNLKATTMLLAASDSLGAQTCKLTNSNGLRREFDAYVTVARGESVLEFLRAYKWSESSGRNPIHLELSYIGEELSKRRLNEWLILLPQTDAPLTHELRGSGFPALSVIGRSRVSATRFGVFSEPRHRDVAQYLVGGADSRLVSPFLRDYRNPNRPIMVLYLVNRLDEKELPYSVGFGIQFSGPKVAKPIVWSIVDPTKNAVVDRTDASWRPTTARRRL
jgi:hypothetical protein